MPQPRFIPPSKADGHLSRKNTSGGTLAANRYVMPDPANEDGMKYPTAADAPIMGVLVASVPNGEWGDIYVLPGVIAVENAGGITQGDRLTTDTSGRAVTAAPAGGTNVSLGGVALRTVATTVVDEVFFPGPFISRQG